MTFIATAIPNGIASVVVFEPQPGIIEQNGMEQPRSGTNRRRSRSPWPSYPRVTTPLRRAGSACARRHPRRDGKVSLNGVNQRSMNFGSGLTLACCQRVSA